jgi:hypothetical protein
VLLPDVAGATAQQPSANFLHISGKFSRPKKFILFCENKLPAKQSLYFFWHFWVLGDWHMQFGELGGQHAAKFLQTNPVSAGDSHTLSGAGGIAADLAFISSVLMNPFLLSAEFLKK